MNKDWEINASPHFTKARCPKHGQNMIELENGWFGNPVWWCTECKFVYELKFMKMKSVNQEEVDKQLKTIWKEKN